MITNFCRIYIRTLQKSINSALFLADKELKVKAISLFALIIFIAIPENAFAFAFDADNLSNSFKSMLENVTAFMASILFFKILGFPILVLWLIVGAVFFTIRLGFVNITLFGHALKVISGKYSKPDDPGEVSHFQALVAAVSATVGIGNVAGVAIAVSVGGPGAVIWMMIAGFFGMSTKFAEVTLGHKYREIDENGKVSGGAFNYLEKGLAEMNLAKLGKIMAIIFSIFCIGGSFGAGNLFQANQTVAILTGSFSMFADYKILISAILMILVSVVILGGIKRITIIAASVVPLMAFIYVTACIVVLIMNSHLVADAIKFMFADSMSGQAAGGGLLGAIITGFQRSVFSNEAGLGSAPIAHSAAKTKEPVRAGCVAILEPFIDTMVICMMTGVVITVTGVYQGNENAELSGVLLTSKAFESVISWFPIVLSIAVALFAYSTMITWSYYGSQAWEYLFGSKTLIIYNILFCVMVFFGGILNDIALIVNFSDLLLLSMAIPNLIGLYLMQNKVKAELDKYRNKCLNKPAK